MGRHRYTADQIGTICDLREAGATVEQRSLASFIYQGAGDCQNPVTVELKSRPQSYDGPRGKAAVVVGPTAGPLGLPTPIPLFLDCVVRCRVCERCLRFRRKRWLRRMLAEVHDAQRTWFVTLTVRPDRHHYYLEVARALGKRASIDIDTLKDEERFAYRVRALGTEVTKFLKRVRKNASADVRYIVVYERHKSGDPHIHLLMHERRNSKPVLKRVLQAAWHDGFSCCKLVEKDGAAAYYVSKYLAKDASTRIRASSGYGGGAGGAAEPPANTSDGHSKEMISDACKKHDHPSDLPAGAPLARQRSAGTELGASVNGSG